GKPIDELLAKIEAPGGRMPGLDEAAALLEPVDVYLFQQIVPEKNHDDQDEPRHEREADEVVHVLRRLRDVGERFGADERQKHDLAEGDVQAGQAEDNERDRRQPM